MTVARALGPGSLRKRPLPAGGANWTLDFTNAKGRRRRVVLGSDRVAQTPLWRTLLETGARYGELQALAWADVDLAGQLITLRAETTKAERGRVLPIRQGLVLDLLALRMIHERVLGRASEPTDHVFLSPEGHPLPKHTVNAMRIFDRLLKSAGIPRVDAQGYKVDIHGLRGTAASRLARSGAPVAVTQRLLGHADARTTLRHYVHVQEDELRQAIEELPDPARAREAGGRAS